MSLQYEIAAVESAVPDPSQGLPEDVFLFVSRIVPLVNVDLLIQDDEGRTLFTWRDDEFFGAGWHLPGGVIRYRESAGERVRSCARGELGAEVKFEEAPLWVAEYIRARTTGEDRKSRGHAISLLYRCRLITPPMESLRADSNAPRKGQWCWYKSLPENLIEAHSAYRRFF